MGKKSVWAFVFGCTLALSMSLGCKSDDDTGEEGTDGGNGGPDNGLDPLNPACPVDIDPQTGKYAPRGECCHRASNKTRVDAQGDGDLVSVEYRLNYVQTTNHDSTIGADAIRMLTMARMDREQQSVLWRFKGPRTDGKAGSGAGTIEIGSGRYNCDGTYSFYSKTAAPTTATQTEKDRWAHPTVPVTIDASITEADKTQLRVVPDFAKNANRGYTYTPYINSSTYELDWELVNQGYIIESMPTEDASLECVGKRNDDANGWTSGGTFVVYTPMAKNDSEPIADLAGQTYCQLVAFGVVLDKGSAKNSCTKTPRCKPGTGTCTWRKLPDSLCPVNADEQSKWGCHIGDEDNADGEPTHCTAEAPTGALDPAKGATSEGQCCDPLGESKTLPACNSYFLRNEYVAAAAEITDDLAESLQPDCSM